LSKRTGATSVEEYRSLGILPQALFNFLLLLGWSPGGDRELLTREEAWEAFDLSAVNKAPAVFDVEKLLWVNGQYLIATPAEEILPHLEPFLSGEALRDPRLLPVVELNRSRGRTLREVGALCEPYFGRDDGVAYEEEAVAKHLKGDDLVERLTALRDRFAALEPFTIDSAEEALREVAAARGVGAGKLIHPLRVALLGRTASPPIFDVAVALGKESTLRRLERLIAAIPSL
jgi:nondiscriminating glutamyl-tRNA synthetase